MLALLIAVGVAYAQAQTQPQNPAAARGGSPAGDAAQAPGISPEQARQAAGRMGLTPEQVRQKRREAGVEGKAVDSYGQIGPAPPSDVTATGQEEKEDDSTLPRPAEAATGARPGQDPFGAEIFRYSPTTFEPLAYGPVGPDYVIGPSDELLLTIWGDDQLSVTLPVNREGFVILPEVGQLQVGGLTLDGVRKRFHTALARIYSGLRPRGRRATTFVNVSLGRLRSIQVFILGHVVRPGGYTLSAVSRVLNALYAAGGPSRAGSMRDIRVMRGGQAVATVDLYDVILRGDASKEVRLENGDVIFVPPAGRRVSLSGAVRRPGLFELQPREQLRALFGMAGGPLATADLSRAQIDRVIPPEMRDSLRGQDHVAIDVPLGDVLANPKSDVQLTDADQISVSPVGSIRVNTVVIHGQTVIKPGIYEFRPGMRLKDLVERAGGLAPDAFLERAQITRTAPDLTRSVLRVNLHAALAGRESDNLELQALDELAVASKWDMQQRSIVSIHGLVRHPGEFELLDGMTLADLLFAAGGLSDEAFPVRAEIARVDSLARGESANADTFSVPLARDFFSLPQATSLRLKKRDAVFIRRDPAYREQVYVTVSGEVRFPGIYAVSRRGERIVDLVQRAGGLTEAAYPEAAVFTRPKVGRINFDLPKALQKPLSYHNLAVESGDELRVPRYEPLVSVEGAVRNPCTTLFKPGESLSYYITQASGFRHDADRRGVVVVMANGDVRRRAVPDAGSCIQVAARPDSTRGEVLKGVSNMLTIVVSAATTLFIIERATR